MANPWETDSPNFRSGGSFPWARTLAGLILVGSVTFALAYYLPLHKAHEALTARHREISQKAKATEERLAALQTELQTVTKKRDELQAAAAEREGSSKSAGNRVESLKSALAEKLEKIINKGQAALGAEGGRVLLAISAKSVFGAKNDVSTAGKALLCDVAKLSESYPLRVAAVGGAAPTPGSAATSPWTASATQAAKVAQALEDKCRVAPGRLSAAGRGATTTPSKAFEASKVPEERVEIEIVTDAE